MQIELVKQATDPDALVLGATGAEVPGIEAQTLAALGFEGKTDQVVTVPDANGGPVRVVVGLGETDGEAVTPAALRRAAAIGVRSARRHDTVAVDLLGEIEPDQRAAAAQAVAEGVQLGAYRFGRYKSGDDPVRTSAVQVVGAGGRKVADAVVVGQRIGEAQCLARDLVNEPGGALTPAAFAQVAVEVAERENLSITVMDFDDITAAGLGGLLGVNRGSHNPPRLVVLAYEPPAAKGTLAMVGKGITFDSGGLSLKPADGMMTMKNDMAGAAAVLGAFSAMAAVGVKSRVLGFVPLTDNMTGGDATRPGDVLRIRNGTTVEVLNTDAEGRLVLADALCLAVEEQPDAIVDLATLTGAVDIALGPAYAGVLGNNDPWIDQVREAGERVGEGLWPLPLVRDYRRLLESEVADLRNISKNRSAGTITAGLFLSEFVGNVPWAHLDIAAAAWSGENRGADVIGGTGFGVRTLLEVARTFTTPG
jgi:leucyl aminopeptidase